ncbi:unnamed protein product [Callosobruchus maculatus]|uniref:Transmembrane protein 209 n=1 Tax=Callosobruchus maculatus TaxID=64391 RepID=A0A653BVT0_CALMS|nr:unnamed protein product [Callosobruchus maculatus]
MSCCTPNSRVLPGKQSPVLERTLLVNQKRRNIRRSLIWGSMNFMLMCLVLYDLSYACPLYVNYYHYAEYAIVVILMINIFYHIANFVKYTYGNPEPVTITSEQKRFLGIKDSDPNYKILDTPRSPSAPGYYSTPMNLSAVSWMSQSDSMNLSTSAASWTYTRGSPNVSTYEKSLSFAKTSPLKNSFHPTSVDHITHEDGLNKYLKEYEETEKINKRMDKTQKSANLLSSFWSHPVTKTAKDVSSFLKKCQYQLSTQSPTKLTTGSPSSKDDKTLSPSQIGALEVWTRINVDSVALTQWNKNLRTWMSQTILERLVGEFEMINESLEKHGLSDIKVGRVGLERLRKTAQMVPVSQYIPSLGTLLPFLEVTTNQEYLVKRIRELAKAGCMSEFKWNGGGSYNGKPWDESLPTDCKIVMHLLATYLDTQLMPSPNMPDTKAFSGYYYIKMTDKMPELKPNSLFIQEVSEKPPHYRVVVGEKVYEMVKVSIFVEFTSLSCF